METFFGIAFLIFWAIILPGILSAGKGTDYHESGGGGEPDEG